MHNSFGKKAQFFILTAVIVVGVFFTLSKYVSQYSIIDSSEAAKGAEIFLIDNVKEKALKTIQISNVTNIGGRMASYETFVQEMVSERGYILDLDYTLDYTTPLAIVNITLISDKYTIRSEFSEPIPLT